MFIVEPIIAGVIVGLLNRYVFNPTSVLFEVCNSEITEEDEHSSTSTTVSTDLTIPHIHF